jgi:hypothetical protein
MAQLEGTLTTVSWEEERYDAAPGQPKFTHARVVHELAGAIAGEASVCYLMVYRPDESASYVGLVTVTGTIDGRNGSFVMQDVGTLENGIAKSRWTVLPALGSGAMAGIRGDGHFASDGSSATYRLEVEWL